ncbi:hypothetical protein LCGC14_1819180, partial [marine sediment metagenome]
MDELNELINELVAKAGPKAGQIKVIQERKNGWVVAIRSGKLYLLHSL